MSRRSPDLRLEMLRMRGQIERGQLAAASLELRGGARGIGRALSAVSTLGATLAGDGAAGWLAALSAASSPASAGAFGTAVRWAPLALRLLRVVRRHPVGAVALAAGVLALGAWWRWRERQPQPPQTPQG